MAVTKILTTQNAQITTAAVEVKTLTISGKQVTLSVFRQLRDEPLLTPDITFNGVPWGYVNYHPDKCADDRQHLHVVWQSGSDLLRSKVYAPHVARLSTLWAGLFLEAAVAEGLSRWPDSQAEFGISHLFLSPNVSTAGFTYGGVSFTAKVRDAFAQAYYHGQTREHLKEKALAILGPNGSAGALAALKLPVTEYHAAWAALTTLPHLFIAV